MKKHALAIVMVIFCCSTAAARHYFANITAVDADKGTVTFKIKTKTIEDGVKDTVITAKITKDCVIREGYYRLGKPATTIESDELVNGLKNFVFQNASKDLPLKVDIFTVDADDKDKGHSKGDIVKILVKTR